MEQETGVPAAGGGSGEAVQGTVTGMGESPESAPAAPASDAAPPAGAPAGGVPGPMSVAAAVAAAPDVAPTPGVAPPAEADAAGGGAPGGPVSSRRRFVKWLLGFSVVGTLALVAAPVVSFLVPPKESAASGGGKVAAGTTADIPPGKGKVVAMGSKPVIVVNTDQGVKAYSAICTHLGCIVAYDDQNGAITCPCHGGKFNPQTGAVMGGPPPTPLAPVSVAVEGDTIYLVATS